MYRASKRTFDVLLAIVIAIIVAPFAVLLAILLWFAQRAVIFRQLRPGLRGKPFVLYKFCSMKNARDDRGQLLPDDQRLTRIGSFVRGLSLDELPQLWNVIKGEMSLVGPRPLLMEYLERYTPEQARRHDVRPGITGWAQVNGRNAVDWNERFAMDVWYVDHRSLWLDLRILWLTVFSVLRRSGISNQNHATMPTFQGDLRCAVQGGETHQAGHGHAKSVRP
jgi:lipopolysaccharide/colanic/teichoic acid biosynthesis glycosyltransferase